MKAQVDGLNKMRRGHGLGAFDLSDLLLTERLTHDAFRAEAIARTAALKAITKLRIDSHSLWIGNGDHEHIEAE